MGKIHCDNRGTSAVSQTCSRFARPSPQRANKRQLESRGSRKNSKINYKSDQRRHKLTSRGTRPSSNASHAARLSDEQTAYFLFFIICLQDLIHVSTSYTRWSRTVYTAKCRVHTYLAANLPHLCFCCFGSTLVTGMSFADSLFCNAQQIMYRFATAKLQTSAANIVSSQSAFKFCNSEM